MVATIKINNPIVGGIIVFIALLLLWFIWIFSGIFRVKILDIIIVVLITISILYTYYRSFWGSKPT